MEQTMIKTKTGYFYRVPEDMFPFAANNLVVNGLAEWVERKEPTVAQKAKNIVSNVKQAVHNKIETAAIKRDVRTATMPEAPPRVIVDTDALSNDDVLDFSTL